MAAIFAFLMLGGGAALLTSLYPESLPALRAGNRRRFGMDAAMAVLAAIGFAILAIQLRALLMDRFHAQALFSIGAPALIASAAPSAAAIAEGVRSLLMNAIVLAIVAAAARRLSSRWTIVPLVLLAAFAFLPLEIRTAGEFALQYGAALAAAGAAALFSLVFARDNYLAYAMVLWIAALWPALAQLFGNRNPALDTQGWIVIAVLAATMAWALLPAVAKRADTKDAAA
jgi:hypothetical protein